MQDVAVVLLILGLLGLPVYGQVEIPEGFEIVDRSALRSGQQNTKSRIVHLQWFLVSFNGSLQHDRKRPLIVAQPLVPRSGGHRLCAFSDVTHIVDRHAVVVDQHVVDGNNAAMGEPARRIFLMPVDSRIVHRFVFVARVA